MIFFAQKAYISLKICIAPHFYRLLPGFIEVRDSRTGYLVPVLDAPGESRWDAVLAVAAVSCPFFVRVFDKNKLFQKLPCPKLCEGIFLKKKRLRHVPQTENSF